MSFYRTFHQLASGGGGMNSRWLEAVSIVAALLVEIPLAAAADLPLKAPPAVPPTGFFWAELDALAWSVKGDRLPPLVTTSPDSTPRAQAGILGLPTTTVLFGDSSVDAGWRAGGRLQAGYWFDPQRIAGIEVSFFDLQNASTGFAAGSNGNVIIARPFFNASTNQQDANLISFPAVVSGSASVNESSRLLGAGALYRQQIENWDGQHIYALIGYRYLHSADQLSIPSVQNSFLFPASLAGIDAFSARSDFHGVDLGLAGEWQCDRWTLEWRGKVALGGNFSSASINGLTTATALDVLTTSPGGLLALSSNIGSLATRRPILR
jgi:hypothetical protein